MLNKTIIAIALTLTVATATSAFAAGKRHQPVQNDNSWFASEQADQLLPDRAKGSIY